MREWWFGACNYHCPTPVKDCKSENTNKMDRMFVARWKRIFLQPPNRATLTDENISDFLTHCFRYTAKCRKLSEDDYSKANLDQGKTYVSQWLGENQLPRFVQINRDVYPTAWKTLQGMKRSQ